MQSHDVLRSKKGSAAPRLFSMLLATAPFLGAQNLGTAPQPSLDSSNIYSAFKLPLRDWAGSPASVHAADLQVATRARKIRITSQSPLEAWTAAGALLAVPLPAAPTAAPVLFSGSTASSLNAALADPRNVSLRVISPAISIDVPIDIPLDGLKLDFGVAVLTAAAPPPWFIRISGRRNVTITGGIFSRGNSAIVIDKSSGVTVDHAVVTDFSGNGIVVSGSSHVTLTHSRISGQGGPGVVLIAGTSLSVVEQNDITNGAGQLNWQAGILVTDRGYDVALDPRAVYDLGVYGGPAASIRDRVNPTRDNVIAFNHVAVNRSSGLYFDGGVRMTVFGNTIQGNAKEGMCLDDGATANVVTSNVFQQNGNRWGQTDEALKTDFVFARLPDGTAAAKLPAISIDNAMYNVIYANNLSHNFGGGVKMVRTAYFNVVGLNTMESNNDGATIYFRYFGVELGAGPADVPTGELDFTPSRGNVIFSNVIRGAHGAGIFFQGGSDQNEIFNNIVMDAKDYAIESPLPMENDAWSNLTNLPSLYVDGCCSYTPPPRGRTPKPL